MSSRDLHGHRLPPPPPPPRDPRIVGDEDPWGVVMGCVLFIILFLSVLISSGFIGNSKIETPKDEGVINVRIEPCECD